MNDEEEDDGDRAEDEEGQDEDDEVGLIRWKEGRVGPPACYHWLAADSQRSE
jgi:hypothetical protein